MSDTLATQADEALLEQCGARSDDAFDVLVSRYKDRLIDLAHWLLGDHESAWNIVQKVFVSLYFTPRAARRVRKASVWLYAETLRGIRGHQRRQRWRAAAQNLLRRAGTAHQSAQPAAAQGLSRPDVPDEDKLRFGLSILPDPLKEVYVLCDLQGLAVEEVGHILRSSQAEVQAQIEKARVVFREIVYQNEEAQ